MPIYCYKCLNCGNEEEHLEQINPPPRICSGCGEPTEKVPAVSNFVIN